MKQKILFIISFVIFLQINFAQWTEQIITPTPPKLNCVAADIPFYYLNQVGWIGGDSGTILFTSNGGTNWVYRNNSTIGNLNINVITILPQQFMTISSGALCSATSSNTTYIYRSSNQGLNWSVVYQQPNGRIRSIAMFDTSIGYAIGDPVGGRWTILKTTNKGLSFDSSGLFLPQNGSELSNYNSFYINRSVYNDSSYFLFGTNSSRLYRSINRGITWTSIILPFLNIYTIHFAEDPSFSDGTRSREWGYAAGNGTLYSTNFGLTWTPITPPGTGDIHSFYCDDGSYSCYCKESQIYFSTNTTQTFTLQYTSPNGGNYTQIGLRAYVFEGGNRNGWAVKDNGAVSKYNYVWAGIKKISCEIPELFSLSQNYPNPFNPTTKIKFSIPKIPLSRGLPAERSQAGVDAKSGRGVFTTLIIYDILGREVATLVNEKLQPGTYEVVFDAANYPSGVYFYKLTSNNFSETKKLVLLK